jgi:colanic acid biosynthesis glycosyl transferase WcaI
MGRRVVFINRFFYPDQSATSQILSDLAFDLADETEVCVVTSRLRFDSSKDVLPKREQVRGVQVHRIWSSRFGRSTLLGRALDYASFYASAALALWSLSDRRTTIVSKTDPPLISFVAAPIARLRGARLINWLQDLFPEVAGVLGIRIAQGPVLQVLKQVRNKTLHMADTNVVLGESMRRLLMLEGIPESQITVIHNWADGDAIAPVDPTRNALRTSWGLQGQFVVGYSGNLGRAHEFQTILAAAERLGEHELFTFLFIGGGAQHAALREEVERRSLRNIIFRPYQDRARLSESLGVADVHLVTLNPALEGLIVPSKYYGVAAAGRPTLFIGNVCGEIPRILSETGSGLAIQTGDVQALVNALERLRQAPDERGEMGRNARTAFEARFQRTIAIERWREVLAT